MGNKTLFNKDTKGCLQETVILKPITLFAYKMEMHIPVEMDSMSQDNVDVFYPYENRPAYIFSDMQCKRQLTFQLFSGSFTEDMYFETVKSVYGMVEKQFPHEWMSPLHLFCDKQIPIIWFLTNITNCKCIKRHIKYLTLIGDQIVLGTMTYPMEEFDKWQPVIKKMFSTLRIGNENEKN